MMKFKIQLLFLLFLSCSQASLYGQETGNRFIPESAFAVLDVDVEQIKQQFMNADGQFVSEYFPAEILTAMGETYVGFDYMSLRKIRIVVAEGESSLADLRVGLVYEFENTVDIGSKFEDVEVTSDIEGRPVYMDVDFGLECMQLDESTVLHATEGFMAELVQARDVSTPLTALLAASKAKDSEVLGVMSFEQIKDAYAELVAENPIPKPMSFLNGIHRFLKSAEFRVADHMMTLEMQSEDEKSAGKLQMIAKRLVGMGKVGAKSNMGMMMGMEGDPVMDSMSGYAVRLIDLIATELAPKQEGNQVMMQIKTDAAWCSILPFLWGGGF